MDSVRETQNRTRNHEFDFLHTPNKIAKKNKIDAIPDSKLHMPE